ncbi:hypothetical protein [Campylobacter concisus]|uniref:hypothetical protein n=1 Tax=Campylobacter concisus TaxID=199 RepID=UPI000D3242C5|nr:hypothetical protein [Campylobacter concisus]
MSAKGTSAEEICGLGCEENKLFKESFMRLSDLRRVLAKLSLLGDRISQIQTKNARVYCSISFNWEFEIYIVCRSFRGSRCRFKPEKTGLVFEIDLDVPDPEVDEILEKLFEILKAPKLKNAGLGAYLAREKRRFNGDV